MKDNEDWRQEYLEMKVHDQKSKQLLQHGAKSLSQSWYLQAMYIDYKKRKGIRDPEPPNCQSSFKEFESRINQQKIKRRINDGHEKRDEIKNAN